MRMHMRRFSRLTNAFLKKVEHHAYAVALHFSYDSTGSCGSALRWRQA